MPLSATKVGIVFALLLSLGCNEHERLAMKARVGNRRAMYEYGMDLWKHATGPQKEADEAIAWITKAAEKGETDAMYELALIYGGGGVNPHPKAVFWLNKGAASGDRFCMIKLAEAYRYGWLGLPVDKAEAKKWFDASEKARKPGGM